MLRLIGLAILLMSLSSCFKANHEKLSLQREVLTNQSSERTVTVRFYGKVGQRLPIEFRPLKQASRVKVNEEHEILYRFINHGSKPVEVMAQQNIRPLSAIGHLKKSTCFCFEKQILAPGETKDLPVRYLVAKELHSSVDTLELRYVLNAASQPPTAERNDSTLSMQEKS